MRDYEMLGHMSPICQSEVIRTQSDGVVQCLPHRGIWQKADHGRKLWVVFDASRRCGSVATLNERLRPRPPLQADVIAIIMRWREPRVVFYADIQMMYRQILVHPEDTDLQRIVWQSPGENKVEHFRLLSHTGLDVLPIQQSGLGNSRWTMAINIQTQQKCFFGTLT